MDWLAPASGKRGRAEKFSDAAIQFCLMVKNLFGLGAKASHRYGGKLIVTIPPELADAGLLHTVSSPTAFAGEHLLSPQPEWTAFAGRQHRCENVGRRRVPIGHKWKTKKHGADYRRQWRKVHLAIDAETLEIRAIEVTSNRVGDAQVLPDLLNQIPRDEQIESLSGDGAYDAKKVHHAAADRGAEAIIPVRKNGKPWKENTPGAQARNETLRSIKRLSRAIWKKWSCYHRRSLVETKMRCFKLLGERVKARIFNSQVAELQIRTALLNRFTQLGKPMTVAAP